MWLSQSLSAHADGCRLLCRQTTGFPVTAVRAATTLLTVEPHLAVEVDEWSLGESTVSTDVEEEGILLLHVVDGLKIPVFLRK